MRRRPRTDTSTPSIVMEADPPNVKGMGNKGRSFKGGTEGF